MSSKKIRLAIGSDEKCESSIWRLWTNHKGDVYLSVRVLGGIYKMSLHRDGKCQFGFTAQYEDTAGERFGVKERHLELWELPDENIVRAVQILIPASELRNVNIDDSKKITWLKPPPQDAVGTISVFICKPGEVLEVPDDSSDKWLVSRLETSIRDAIVTYAFTYPDETLTEVIVNEKSKLAKIVQEKGILVSPGSRAALWDSKEGHNRHVLELACD
jgi:hypothetical protein